MVSCPILYSEEARDEIIKRSKSREAYVGGDGKLRISGNSTTTNLVVKNMTGNVPV